LKALTMQMNQIIVGASLLVSSCALSFAQDRKTEQATKHRRADFTYKYLFNLPNPKFFLGKELP